MSSPGLSRGAGPAGALKPPGAAELYTSLSGPFRLYPIEFLQTRCFFPTPLSRRQINNSSSPHYNSSCFIRGSLKFSYKRLFSRAPTSVFMFPAELERPGKKWTCLWDLLSYWHYWLLPDDKLALAISRVIVHLSATADKERGRNLLSASAVYLYKESHLSTCALPDTAGQLLYVCYICRCSENSTRMGMFRNILHYQPTQCYLNT